MAICSACNQEMTNHLSCVEMSFDYKGELFDPIPYGQERYHTGDRMEESNCHDCGTPFGGFHHVGCDMEECPRCHGQAISCECEVE